MYIPEAFAETNLEKLQAAVQQFDFAVLVSGSSGNLMASHLPLLLDRTTGNKGTLLGHMARANNQWEQAAGSEVLAIFSGPHAYISPQWYETPKTVPTWNYVAIHAYGCLELIESEADSIALLRQTVEVYESPRSTPWKLDEDEEFLSRLAKQIVAFRIPIERLEGKWKLNQNHPVERRERVVRGLRASGCYNDSQIAELMAATIVQSNADRPDPQ